MSEIYITATIEFKFSPNIESFPDCKNINQINRRMVMDIEHTLQTEMPDNSVIHVTGEIK